MGNHSKCYRCGELDEYCVCPAAPPVAGSPAEAEPRFGAAPDVVSKDFIERMVNGIGGGTWANGALTLRQDELEQVIKGVANIAVRNYATPAAAQPMPASEAPVPAAVQQIPLQGPLTTAYLFRDRQGWGLAGHNGITRRYLDQFECTFVDGALEAAFKMVKGVQ